MRYYKFIENGVIAFLQVSEKEKTRDGYREISKDEYVTLGGVVPVHEHTELPTPSIAPLTETQLAVAELAQVVDENNTVTQLALAELAGLVLGG